MMEYEWTAGWNRLPAGERRGALSPADCACVGCYLCQNMALCLVQGPFRCCQEGLVHAPVVVRLHLLSRSRNLLAQSSRGLDDLTLGNTTHVRIQGEPLHSEGPKTKGVVREGGSWSSYCSGKEAEDRVRARRRGGLH